MDSLFILIILFAVLMYVINTFFELAPKLKQGINLLLLVLFLFMLFGWPGVYFHHAVTIH